MTNTTKLLIEPDQDIKLLKEKAKVVDLVSSCDANVNVEIDTLQDEYVKARKQSSAKLYASLSKLINYSAWCIAIIVLLLVVWWSVLEGQIAYGDCTTTKLSRLQETKRDLEGFFSYVLTTALGFAGGVCKMFLNFNKN